MIHTLKLAAVALACWPAVAGAADVAADLEQGAKLLAPFKQELQKALQSGLAEGPVEAIDSCRQRAPDIAESLSHDGVRVGRSSHKLRNPANAGPDWLWPILEDYLSAGDRRVPRTVSLPDNRVGYAEPIIMQPQCLACHGSSIAEAVRHELQDQYPEDEATGFAVGDLRGVFWVEFPAGR